MTGKFIRRAALCILMCVSVPLPVAGQVVHKCVDASGLTSYQSQPCADGHRPMWTRAYAQDPAAAAPSVPTPESAPKRETPSSRPRTSGQPRVRRSRATAAHIGVTANANSRACAAAKQRRQATLGRVGLKRDFDLLRRLDDAVYRACD